MWFVKYFIIAEEKSPKPSRAESHITGLARVLIAAPEPQSHWLAERVAVMSFKMAPSYYLLFSHLASDAFNQSNFFF